MENLKIFIPQKPLEQGFFSDSKNNELLLSQLRLASPKNNAYFDETIDVYVLLEAENGIQGILKIETLYQSDKHKLADLKRNRQKTTTLLGDPIIDTKKFKIWQYRLKIKPGRNFNKLVFNVLFEKERSKVDVKLKPFEEPDLTEICNIDLVSASSINNSAVEEKSSISTLNASYEINVTSLYKMSLKSFKTADKTLAWLDLSTSNMLNELRMSVEIQSIGVECIGSELILCTPITFPVILKENTVLTVAYKVSYDDDSTLRPLTVKVNAIVDHNMEINTQWTSNLDLSTAPLAAAVSNSTGNLLIKNKQAGLLPPAKLPKLRSYGNLISNTSPKLPPPRIPTKSFINNTGPIKHTDSGMGGKRYTSVRIKSGSNLSLSQLWSGTTSQSFQRGLVVTVSGPTKVKLGETFRWKIQLLNKSSAKMDLILYVQSSIKKEYEKTIPPIPIQSANKNDSVPLFNNNQLVRSFYYKFNRAGIVSLTNNLRVSLEYGNLYECDLELMSVERGMFNIYDFKVLDISSGDIFECNRLLDVTVI